MHWLRGRNEVDLVLEKSDSRVIGVEVKASATVRESDFKGLIKLSDYAGQHFQHGVLLYTGNEILPFKLKDREFHAIPFSILEGCSKNLCGLSALGAHKMSHVKG